MGGAPVTTLALLSTRKAKSQQCSCTQMLSRYFTTLRPCVSPVQRPTRNEGATRREKRSAKWKHNDTLCSLTPLACDRSHSYKLQKNTTTDFWDLFRSGRLGCAPTKRSGEPPDGQQKAPNRPPFPIDCTASSGVTW